MLSAESGDVSLSSRARNRMSIVLSSDSRPGPILSQAGRSAFRDYSDDGRLDLLRLLAYYGIRSLLVEPDVDSNEEWNLREILGLGASFLVQQAAIPISATVSYLRYRDFKSKGSEAVLHFQDHTQTRWSYDSKVAFKISNRGQSSLLSELRILCHMPLQTHPNIAHLIGVAWITAQSGQDLDGNDEILEWPAILLEQAPHGSLNDFLTSRKNGAGPQILLRTKLFFWLDMLKAITVFHVS